MRHISQFLEAMRESVSHRPATAVRNNPQHDEPQPSTSSAGMEGEASHRAHKLIVEAERHHVETELPRGNTRPKINFEANLTPNIDISNVQGLVPQSVGNNVESAMKNKPVGITDDEFFHLTCHVDPNLKQKIEHGEFVELEKLLVKDRFKSSGQDFGQRMELVSRGGETFIMPADRDQKITNIRKWEQAFYIYAAIYSQANPHRSSEIWQYVFVINSAASTYVWENVASYDFTFRQLMACNPMRNWLNIYHQMWNLTMREVIPRNNFQNQGAGDSGNKKGSQSKRAKRTLYCWSFNRGEKCKFDPHCKFIKRCSYCDSAAHGQFECPKLKDKDRKSK